MSVGEKNPSSGEPVNVGRPGVRMPTEAANPVVQIIDGDEEDIGFSGRLGILARCNKLK